jgi:ketosteroid isomerase-like protein
MTSKNTVFLTVAFSLLGIASFSQPGPGRSPATGKEKIPSSSKNDYKVLQSLNAQFIRNFIDMDTVAHNKIIHEDFVCINPDGSVSNRNDYMREWLNGYTRSGYITFVPSNESIRIFGNMALVRSITVYTKEREGKTIKGATIYTDTYIKENGRWRCVQAHLTPVKN